MSAADLQAEGVAAAHQPGVAPDDRSRHGARTRVLRLLVREEQRHAADVDSLPGIAELPVGARALVVHSAKSLLQRL